MNRESRRIFRSDLAGQLPAPQAPWLLGALRELRLPAILAGLALAALALAFLEVVSGAVEQGQTRRQAQLSQADATWRCNAQRDSLLRSNCRAELALASGTSQTSIQGSEAAAADLRGPQ
jgi:hypothetical protein